jgi:hypothetical protein
MIDWQLLAKVQIVQWCGHDHHFLVVPHLDSARATRCSSSASHSGSDCHPSVCSTRRGTMLTLAKRRTRGPHSPWPGNQSVYKIVPRGIKAESTAVVLARCSS